MTVEQYLFLKGAIESTDTKELIEVVMKELNEIKDLITRAKMIVLELQKRKEKQNGK